MLQEALFQLQDETQRKLNMLLGEELELRRRFAHIEWAEGRLERNRNEMAPPDFIHSWENHQILRKRMYSYRDMGASVLNDVQPDLNVVGGVQIVVENRSEIGQLSTLKGQESTSVARSMKGLDASSEFRKAVFNNAAQTNMRSNGSNGSGLMSKISESYGDNQSANNLVSSMRRAMQSGDKMYGGQGVGGAPSPTVAGMGLSSTSLATQDTRSYLRNRSDVHGRKANSNLIENIQSPNGMDGVWMSALRRDGNKSQTPNPANRNVALQEEMLGVASKAEETKKQSSTPSTPDQMMPSPSKRSGGPRSGVN